MKYIFICSLLISLQISAMNEPRKKTSYVHIKTDDNQIVAIDKTIAQESNLITTLLKKYSGSRHDPIPIKVSYEAFTFFCEHIVQPPATLLTTLSDKNYAHLMAIADKLKALPFYAELMEQLITVPELRNSFVHIILNQLLLKQAVYKKYYSKKCIKNSLHDTTDNFTLLFSNNGKHFADTISYDRCDRMTLWDAPHFNASYSIIHPTTIVFSPTNKYLLVYCQKNGSDKVTNLGIHFLKNHQFKLFSTDSCHTHNITLIPSPKGQYILQELSTKEGHTKAHPYTLYYINSDNQIALKILREDIAQARRIIFHPNGKQLICSLENSVVLYDINNPKNTREIYRFDEWFDPQLIINQKGNLLVIDSDQLFDISNKPTKIRHLDGHNKLDALLFIPQKNIVAYQSYQHLYIIDEDNKKLLKYQTGKIRQLAADTSGTYLATICERYPMNSEFASTLLLLNLTTSSPYVSMMKIIFPQANLYSIAFTKDQLLAVQSHTLQLLDMQGDTVLNLGECQKYAINPQYNFLMTAKRYNEYLRINDTHYDVIPGPTKMYLHTINTHQVQKTINNITNSLTLSLLINAHFSCKKKKELYSNLPSGRALTAFKQDEKFKNEQFLVKRFTLKEKQYNQPALKLLT
jgi:WD40 repeat protein